MFFTDSCKLFCLEKYISSFSFIQNLMLGCFPKTKLTTIFPIVSEANSIKQCLHCSLPVFFKILAKQLFCSMMFFLITTKYWSLSFITLLKKWSFPLKISLVNVTNSAHSLKKSLLENFIFLCSDCWKKIKLKPELSLTC